MVRTTHESGTIFEKSEAAQPLIKVVMWYDPGKDKRAVCAYPCRTVPLRFLGVPKWYGSRVQADCGDGDGGAALGDGLLTEPLDEEIAAEVPLLRGDDLGLVLVAGEVGALGEEDIAQFGFLLAQSLDVGANVGELIDGVSIGGHC
jgi:hypothetical protein